MTTFHGIYNARSPLKRFYNSVMARGDVVIANSEYTREHILEYYDVDPAQRDRASRAASISIVSIATQVSAEDVAAHARAMGRRAPTTSARADRARASDALERSAGADRSDGACSKRAALAR